MRYIIIFLILANVAYFGWHLYAPSPPMPATVAAPRPLLNQGLVLLSEFNEQAAAIADERARQSAELARHCYVAGDFNGLDDANNFTQKIENAGYRAQLKLTGEPLDSRFRVYLAPASSREIATITLDGLSERLTSENLQIETYLITRGVLENAIALGVFAQRASAENVRDQIQEMGYAPEIEEIPRSSGPLQVTFSKNDFSELETAEWLDFAGDRPDLGYLENLCETIAQGPQFP